MRRYWVSWEETDILKEMDIMLNYLYKLDDDVYTRLEDAIGAAIERCDKNNKDWTGGII